MSNDALQIQLVPAFLDQIELTGTHIMEDLPLSAGPLDLNGFRPRGFAQTKMQSEIALRNVTSAAAHLLQLLLTIDMYGDPRANPIAIGLRPYQFQHDPVSVLSVVLQQAGRVMAVVHENLHVTVVIEIGGGHAMAVERLRNALTEMSVNFPLCWFQ